MFEIATFYALAICRVQQSTTLGLESGDSCREVCWGVGGVKEDAGKGVGGDVGKCGGRCGKVRWGVRKGEGRCGDRCREMFGYGGSEERCGVGEVMGLVGKCVGVWESVFECKER